MTGPRRPANESRAGGRPVRRLPGSPVYIPSSFGPFRVHTLWPMAPTVSLSARVSPQVRARLAAEARDQGVALATYAARLLTGAAPDAPGPGAGTIQNEVECAFSH